MGPSLYLSPTSETPLLCSSPLEKFNDTNNKDLIFTEIPTKSTKTVDNGEEDSTTTASVTPRGMGDEGDQSDPLSASNILGYLEMEVEDYGDSYFQANKNNCLFVYNTGSDKSVEAASTSEFDVDKYFQSDDIKRSVAKFERLGTKGLERWLRSQNVVELSDETVNVITKEHEMDGMAFMELELEDLRKIFDNKYGRVSKVRRILQSVRAGYFEPVKSAS